MEGFRKKILYKLVSNKIRFYRKKMNLSQAELANRISISRTSLVNIEKGRQAPPLHIILEIATQLGIGFNDLIPTKEEVKEEVKAFFENANRKSHDFKI